VALAPPKPLADGSVRKLLEDWLAAHNKGNFAAYSALYADRFTGVNRTGSSSRSFGRAAWLDEQRNRLERPMQAAARAVELAVTPSTARLRFELVVGTGAKEQITPKELVVVSTHSGPRIAREETRAASPASVEVAKAPGLDLVLADVDGLLLTRAAEDAWGTGPIEPTGTLDMAARGVDEAQLPPELRGWKGRTVKTIDQVGMVCEARVTGFRLRATVGPHENAWREWRGDGTATVERAKVAEQTWTLSGRDGRVLLGLLDPPCQGIFAIDAKRPAPRAFAPDAPAPELQAEAIAAFRDLPAYREIQKRYESERTDATKPWHEATDHGFAVWIFSPPARPASILVTARVGKGCGDFSASLSAVFQRSGGQKPSWTLLGLPEMGVPDLLTPATAFDFDRDGKLEILSGPEGFTRERAIWLERKGEIVRHVLASSPYLDSPC
jgi:hypothetical protein